MKTTEFKKYYNKAKETKVQEDPLFLSAGYFWINLTEKQQSKMVDLLIKQGATIEDGGIYLANGLKINIKSEIDKLSI